MQAVINNNLFTHQSLDLLAIFKDFLTSVIDNYKIKHKTYELEKRVTSIRHNIKFLNDNLEELIKSDDFEKIEDEAIDLKFYLENLLDTPLPANLKDELNLLCEDLVTFIFNISMYDMEKEVENIRD